MKTPEKDGYAAVQLAYDEVSEKNTSNPLMGHFKRANTTPKRKLVEFTSFEKELNLGDVVTVDIFEDDDWVDVTGMFKGKRLPGRTGGDRVKVLNLRILKKLPENNLLLVKGSIPGAKGSYLIIED